MNNKTTDDKSPVVLQTILSFLIPGVGQFMQGRIGMGILHLTLAFALWYLLLGWLVHFWSGADAYMLSPQMTGTDIEEP